MNTEMMTKQTGSPRPAWAIAAGIVAVVFGVLTIMSGGRALFGGAAARAAMGNAVPFVLWFAAMVRACSRSPRPVSVR